MDPEVMARAETAADRIAAQIADGFDVEDVAVIVKESVEVAEAWGSLDGETKHELAVALAEDLVDRFFTDLTPAIERMIDEADLPGPELIEQLVWEPALKAAAPALLKPALKAAIPALVNLVVGATQGEVKVNPHKRPGGDS